MRIDQCTLQPMYYCTCVLYTDRKFMLMMLWLSRMWHYFPLFDSVQTICILQPAAEGKTLERRTGRVEPNRVLLSFIDSGPVSDSILVCWYILTPPPYTVCNYFLICTLTNCLLRGWGRGSGEFGGEMVGRGAHLTLIHILSRMSPSSNLANNLLSQVFYLAQSSNRHTIYFHRLSTVSVSIV